MKKQTILIIYFTLVFLLSCSSESISIPKNDPLSNAKVIYKIDNRITKQKIKNKLNYFLIKYNQKWSQANKQKFINAVYVGQKEFDIDYKIVMSIVSIESNYNIRAKNKKSNDFGLSQQNNKYIKQRYSTAKKYLDKHKVKSNVKDKYDIALSVMSCYLYLYEIEQSLNTFNFHHYICAYNTGKRGYYKYRETADKYYNRFIEEYINI